jgi:polysaccharide export outer membrane protein
MGPRRKTLFLFLVMLGLYGGIALRSWAEDAPAAAADPQEEGYAIRPGDKLNIKVFREQDLTGAFVVDPSGTVSYPLLGQVRAEGMTLSAFRNYLTETLGKDYLVNPQVEVTLEEGISKSVSILGQVSKPGNYVLSPGMTLVQLISEAGGFTPIAAPNRVRIVRYSPQQDKTISIAVDVNRIMDGNAKDVPLEPKDLVVVSESFF